MSVILTCFSGFSSYGGPLLLSSRPRPFKEKDCSAGQLNTYMPDDYSLKIEFQSSEPLSTRETFTAEAYLLYIKVCPSTTPRYCFTSYHSEPVLPIDGIINFNFEISYKKLNCWAAHSEQPTYIKLLLMEYDWLPNNDFTGISSKVPLLEITEEAIEIPFDTGFIKLQAVKQ